MHEHTRYRRTWIKNPRNWVWGAYTSPSGKYKVRWRGPLMLSVFTYWEFDHDDDCPVAP